MDAMNTTILKETILSWALPKKTIQIEEVNGDEIKGGVDL